jgi:hypothetical protein
MNDIICTQLRFQYKPNKIYVDASKSDFIKSLKTQFNETTNYKAVIEQSNMHKVDSEYRTYVIPLSFREFGKELLGRFQQIVSNGWFSISRNEHKVLAIQMRMAKFKENINLDKGET